MKFSIKRHGRETQGAQRSPSPAVHLRRNEAQSRGCCQELFQSDRLHCQSRTFTFVYRIHLVLDQDACSTVLEQGGPRVRCGSAPHPCGFWVGEGSVPDSKRESMCLSMPLREEAGLCGPRGWQGTGPAQERLLIFSPRYLGSLTTTDNSQV